MIEHIAMPIVIGDMLCTQVMSSFIRNLLAVGKETPSRCASG